MKYYLIVGEASGDLHASHLMQSLCKYDADAQFRFFGGDLMTAVGGTRVRHYRELAYMGFVPVLLHLPTIFRNMAMCKRDIVEWQPDVVILVDYPGFNLNIAQYLHSHTRIPVFYYISPKIWAWKEWRIRNIKRDVSELFSILPFEVPFFEERHHYPIHYVGNPTADEVRNFRASYTESRQDFGTRHQLDDRPIIALLAGSRRQEIKDNLPMMIAATERLLERRGLTRQYQMVLAGAPSIDDAYYAPFLKGHDVAMVRNETYPLLSHAVSALVTSGTATSRPHSSACPRWCATRRRCHGSSALRSTTSSMCASSVWSISSPTARWCPSCLPTALPSKASPPIWSAYSLADPTAPPCSRAMPRCSAGWATRWHPTMLPAL